MAITGVTPLLPETGLRIASELKNATPAQQAGNFVQELHDFVANVNSSQKSAENLSHQFAQGYQNDIHGTMIAATQADISLHFLASVRNRIIDAYREVMRMGA
jgi:flagellar hook-basal body complex protein FliE